MAFTLNSIVPILLTLYVIAVAIFIVLENRSPQSTFAWLLLLILLPFVGLIIYLFFGRSWHAFSRESKLARQAVDGGLLDSLAPLLRRQEGIVARVSAEKPASYNRKLMNLLAHNNKRGSLLTEYNNVEILQDASAKYPRLLADLRRATDSIHLEYYIWTNDDFTQELKDVLIAKADEGVEVRALYDATSAKLMGKAYRNELNAHRVEIYPYLEINSLRKMHNVQYRSHRKIAIIDGKIG